MIKYKLTEEIARWAFEVRVKQSNNWHIAFTNPTAGPWKVITASDDNGKIGEIYRFSSEEVRPDIVIYNDTFKIILIIEAKDCLQKLIYGDQVKKSVEVMVNLSRVLKQLTSSAFWAKRIDYNIYTGVLWGTETHENISEITNVFDCYHSEIVKHPELNPDLIIGIQSFKDKTGSIKCSLLQKQYNDIGLDSKTLSLIAQSLGVVVYQ